MQIPLSMAVAFVGLLPHMVAAQVEQTRPSPTAPSARVPAPHYESAFRNYQPYAEPERAPAAVWRAANDEMARLRGHMGHLQDARLPQHTGDSDAAHTRPPAAHHDHGGK